MMTTTQSIINYAIMRGGVFQRKDVMRHFAENQPNVAERSVDLQINRIVSAGLLSRKGRGKYKLTEKFLPEFIYRPSAEEREIYHKLQECFPFLDFCIWSPKVLSSFMLHVPNVGFTFVDVEKDGMESVFHKLQSLFPDRRILYAPSPEECERYLFGTDSIVVRRLIGQSPLCKVDGCRVPCLEKILVDAVGDNELLFAGGSEIYNIFEYAREVNRINYKKLMRYASRRNRKTIIESIIENIDHDKS